MEVKKDIVESIDRKKKKLNLRFERSLGEGSYSRIYSAIFDGCIYAGKCPMINKSMSFAGCLQETFALKYFCCPQLIHSEKFIKADVKSNELKEHFRQNNFVILMPLADFNLEEFVLNYKNINIDIKIKLLFDLCIAIYYLHECGFMHRDIKPNNILVFNTKSLKNNDVYSDTNRETASHYCSQIKTTNIFEQPFLKLADFDLIRSISSQRPLTPRINKGRMCSPEVNDNIEYDEKIDIWSLGTTAWFLFKGTYFKQEELDNGELNFTRVPLIIENNQKSSTSKTNGMRAEFSSSIAKDHQNSKMNGTKAELKPSEDISEQLENLIKTCLVTASKRPSIKDIISLPIFSKYNHYFKMSILSSIFIDKNPQLNIEFCSKRENAISYLIQSANKFNFDETTHAIELFDRVRFLSKNSVFYEHLYTMDSVELIKYCIYIMMKFNRSLSSPKSFIKIFNIEGNEKIEENIIELIDREFFKFTVFELFYDSIDKEQLDILFNHYIKGDFWINKNKQNSNKIQSSELSIFTSTTVQFYNMFYNYE